MALFNACRLGIGLLLNLHEKKKSFLVAFEASNQAIRRGINFI